MKIPNLLPTLPWEIINRVYNKREFIKKNINRY
jgi:hypothetical protein